MAYSDSKQKRWVETTSAITTYNKLQQNIQLHPEEVIHKSISLLDAKENNYPDKFQTCTFRYKSNLVQNPWEYLKENCNSWQNIHTYDTSESLSPPGKDFCLNSLHHCSSVSAQTFYQMWNSIMVKHTKLPYKHGFNIKDLTVFYSGYRKPQLTWKCCRSHLHTPVNCAFCKWRDKTELSFIFKRKPSRH